MNMKTSSRLHPALRRALSGTQPRAAGAGDVRPLGVAVVDRALGGGLLAGKVHEVFARGAEDDVAAMGFATMLAIRFLRGGKSGDGMLWLREASVQRRAGLDGAGLTGIGLDPARLVLGVLPDARALLRASVDALRCAGLGVVLLELSGNPPLLDLTASRRFALAAEASGTALLLLRLRGGTPMPSAAQTRWDIAPAPSAPLEAGAPGWPALAVSLLRQRGGAAGLDWTLEWDRDAGTFRPAALSGARLPLSGGGSFSPPDADADAGWRAAS